MPAFTNPLKRGADAEDASWSSRKRPSLAHEQEEYWMTTWYSHPIDYSELLGH
jgi:hypothetical protein